MAHTLHYSVISAITLIWNGGVRCRCALHVCAVKLNRRVFASVFNYINAFSEIIIIPAYTSYGLMENCFKNQPLVYRDMPPTLWGFKLLLFLILRFPLCSGYLYYCVAQHTYTNIETLYYVKQKPWFDFKRLHQSQMLLIIVLFVNNINYTQLKAAQTLKFSMFLLEPNKNKLT